MTPAERRKPELIKASRKRRIAGRAGVRYRKSMYCLRIRANAEDDENDEGGGCGDDEGMKA